MWTPKHTFHYFRHLNVVSIENVGQGNRILELHLIHFVEFWSRIAATTVVIHPSTTLLCKQLGKSTVSFNADDFIGGLPDIMDNSLPSSQAAQFCQFSWPHHIHPDEHFSQLQHIWGVCTHLNSHLFYVCIYIYIIYIHTWDIQQILVKPL